MARQARSLKGTARCLGPCFPVERFMDVVEGRISAEEYLDDVLRSASRQAEEALPKTRETRRRKKDTR